MKPYTLAVIICTIAAMSGAALILLAFALHISLPADASAEAIGTVAKCGFVCAFSGVLLLAFGVLIQMDD